MQFGDLRGWIAQLKKEGELHEVDTEVARRRFASHHRHRTAAEALEPRTQTVPRIGLKAGSIHQISAVPTDECPGHGGA